MIWLRRYPTMYHLGVHFHIPVSCVYFTIQRILPVLHSYVVPRYVRWHTDRDWAKLYGFIPKWPSCVGILDCTPFRISKPAGNMQRLFWRRDRKCFFMNWIVIVDVKGYIVYSRPGFVGHLHDSTCLRHVNLPALPHGLQIMADLGFARRNPLLVPLDANGRRLTGRIGNSFSKYRSAIERVFGILKSSYSSVGTRRFRNRRWNATLVCNVTAGLHNRRILLFQILRRHTHD